MRQEVRLKTILGALESTTVKQMTTTVVKMRMKTPMVVQKIPAAEQLGLKIPMVEQKTTTAE